MSQHVLRDSTKHLMNHGWEGRHSAHVSVGGGKSAFSDRICQCSPIVSNVYQTLPQKHGLSSEA